jgi:hypothetical protein
MEYKLKYKCICFAIIWVEYDQTSMMYINNTSDVKLYRMSGCCLTSTAIVQLYHGANKVSFQWDSDEVGLVQHQHA